VIRDQESLGALVTRIQKSKWAAIDTEADSLHAYPEKLCLIQLSFSGGDELVDPLAEVDIQPLLEELSRHELLIHGADYDLRLLKKTYNFLPTEIFDTVNAARLLGYTRFGLNDLLNQKLGISLEKGPQKMNWARRPLTERMLAYAINDVRHLKPLADQLRAELKEKGRLEWHKEMCAKLIRDAECIQPEDPDVIWRVKGCDGLPRKALAVVRELWQWREDEAVASNLPPYFVLSHESLINIAETVGAGKPYRDFLPRKLSMRRMKGIREAIARARALKAHEWPYPRKNKGTRPTIEDQNRFNILRKQRDKEAHVLGIDPTLIASRGSLMALARDWENEGKSLLDWQRRLLQPALKEAGLVAAESP